ncbi:nuclear transport factor 2 family protein [Ramlibacter humi]|uniref:Nuclear transport factor 2 family protein n=1 Tax=Ramlibacter humi TaxID=2530451 RepID=A0A4Z0BR01_9BURK|nr:nuclear transport factor 2 family protein [Ramlibacter humi]TFZ01733.1 nuclear transport factor 2 family protein [Ramlibacter humi]
MAPHDTIETLYAAFARLDPQGMSACYADDTTFDDEAFSLRGKREVMGMWTMLAENVKAQGGPSAWRLEWSSVKADGDRGRAHWEAWYRFSATGRDVHNVIDAEFRFDPQGRIVTHRDRFPFWRWSRQALGTPGLLLGWSPMLRTKVRQRAAGNLARWLEKHPDGVV